MDSGDGSVEPGLLASKAQKIVQNVSKAVVTAVVFQVDQNDGQENEVVES